MNIKVNFAENSSVFRPVFRTPSNPPLRLDTSNPTVQVTTPKPTVPVKFSDVYVVKEAVEPAYGKVQNGDITYDSLNSALEAVRSGDTIVLQSDFNYKAVLSFVTDFCLDLNGHTLTTEGVSVLAKGGSIVDNGATKGLLVVPKGFLVMNHAVYGMLPVWNEGGTGYIFVKVTDQVKPVEIIDDNSFAIEYRPSMAGGGVANKDVFSDGALDNEISFRTNTICYDEYGNIVQTFASGPISDELVARVYTNSTAFRQTVSGVARYSACEVELLIETEAGLTYRCILGRVEK